ncbi:MAG: UDP-N-acetylmuramoyl-tripeptide--D-alanyl-D-alanine ligase [Bacteroidia bacterium]|nr:UDP-N-acetylmuramoyl-tripeptide--D-alanyl-D-alanine ligase [Bacteroidia bacterium]MDW8089119.1 UDP-N-acetylmuramoyl-tripeptide--D-alanyl-D-alanine ligase [Bacteroidia bacterium]
MSALEAVRSALLQGTGAHIDSRAIGPGEVFFALPGRTHHGGEFAAAAWQRGAAWVVLPEGYPPPADVPPDRIAYHPDPLSFLQEVAAAYRQRFTLPLLAIGGSNGKTTTKALIGHLLSSRYAVLVSPRSWNNHLGVPLTLLRLRPTHAIAVVELGDNHPGEIAALCQLARPTQGLLTNIGADHLEGYGDLATNSATKWELVEYLETQGGTRLFLNGEEEFFQQRAVKSSLEVRYFGDHPASCAWGQWRTLDWEWAELEGEIEGEGFRLAVPLWGSFNRLNVLAALAVGKAFGLSLREMAERLKTFSPEAYRSQILRKGGRILILDAYNANPSSLAASLQALWETVRFPQKVALILGQMEELGAWALEAHQKALESLSPYRRQIRGVVLIGPLWEPALERLGGITYRWYSRVEEARAAPPPWLEEAEVWYLKGSRAQAVEKILES